MIAGVGANVRFGSKADMCSALAHVRFTPESGHVQCNRPCPLCANSGLMQRSKGMLFDHLVGLREKRWGDGYAESLGCPEVDHQLELGRCLHRKVARLLALKDAINIAGR